MPYETKEHPDIEPLGGDVAPNDLPEAVGPGEDLQLGRHVSRSVRDVACP